MKNRELITFSIMRRWYILGFVLSFLILLHGWDLSSQYFLNLGILNLVQAQLNWDDPNLNLRNRMSNNFRLAILQNPNNQQAHWYSQIASIENGKTGISLTTDLDDEYFVRAYEAGSLALNNHEYNKAAKWFAVGANLNHPIGSRNFAKLGWICQRFFDSRSMLDFETRKNCGQFWDPQDGNLIINGQFNYGRIGWADLIPVDENRSKLEVDRGNGTPLPSFRMEGKTNDYHGGWFQSIDLPANTELIYRAHVKTNNIENLRVEILVWQIGQNDYQLQSLSEETDWAWFESRIIIPETEESHAIFAPVRVWGKGVVWVDSVTLTISSEAD